MHFRSTYVGMMNQKVGVKCEQQGELSQVELHSIAFRGGVFFFVSGNTEGSNSFI